MQKNFHIDLNGKKRKFLADAIGNILNDIPIYKGGWRKVYKIRECTLEYDGRLIVPESVSPEQCNALFEQLSLLGYGVTVEDSEDYSVITMPEDCLSEQGLENLKRLIRNKRLLFERAFECENPEVIQTSDGYSFAWFPFTTDPIELKAYSHFIEKLCKKANAQSHVRDSVYEGGNDRYSFRCFLLQLGFIGEEYRNSRRVLLRNLEGNAAFRDL